jgi:hypothetical protein
LTRILIAAVRHNTSIETAAIHGEEMRQWLIDHLLRMKNAFVPRLKMATTLPDPSLIDSK